MTSTDAVAMARRAISLLDLTELGDAATPADVESLCQRAVGPCGTVAAVCVWPRHVAQAVELLHGSGVRVATVVNFPSGDDALADVVDLARAALADGADEIDLVLPYRTFLAGDVEHAAAMVAAVRHAATTTTSGAPVALKVILETGELVDAALIRAASELAIANGADFIKTSTGKSPVSATLPATEAMLDVIHRADRPIGLKPSGGIRTLDDAAAFLAQADAIMGDGWATPSTFRFGASGLLTALEAVVAGATDTSNEEGY